MQRIVVLLIFSFFSFYSYSQSDFNGNGTITPSSNSTALAKYGASPLSAANALPQIGIPIYSLSSRSLNTNISLSYYPQGNKKDKAKSWAGYDWSLQAGGMITRFVNGLPDETPNVGYFASLNRGLITPTQTDLSLLPAVAKGELDTEADAYYYNFDGMSGRIVLEKTTDGYVAHTIPQSDLKIIPPTNINDTLQNWTIYTSDGIIYRFGGVAKTEQTNAEISKSTQNIDANGIPSGFVQTSPLMIYDFVSSWYLDKIEDPFETDAIEFSYRTLLSNSTYLNTSEQDFIPYNSSISNKREYKKIKTKINRTLIIDEIRSELGTVKFEIGVLLRGIKVKNLSEEIIHSFQLDYSGEHYITTIKEEINDCLTSFPHRFEYYDGNEAYDPNSGTDHWGYYNGTNALDYTTSIPVINYGDIQIGQADRSIDENRVFGRTLKRVIYPSGGWTKYEYEANRADLRTFASRPVQENYALTTSPSEIINQKRWFALDQAQNITLNIDNPAGATLSLEIRKNGAIEWIQTTTGTSPSFSVSLVGGKHELRWNAAPTALISTPKVQLEYSEKWSDGGANSLVGGIRLKKTTVHDGNDSEKDIITNFEYELENGISSGKLLTYPIYHYTIYEHIDCATSPQVVSYLTASNVDRTQKFVSNALYYTKITKKFGEVAENGYSENTYTFTPQEGGRLFPFVPSKSYELQNGLPLESKLYDKDGNIITHTKKEYEVSSLSLSPNHYQSFPRLIAYLKEFSNCSLPEIQTQIARTVAYQYSPIESKALFLKKTEGYQYDQSHSGESIYTTSTYGYSPNHLYPVEVRSSGNNGIEYISKSKYLLDYDNIHNDNLFSSPDMHVQAMKQLKDKHIIANVIEAASFKKEPNKLPYLLGATINTFQEYEYQVFLNTQGGGGIESHIFLAPLANYAIESNQFITDFQFSSIQLLAPTQLVFDNRYKKQIDFLSYDKYGNLTSANKEDNVPSATIYGYNGAYPIASVHGASHRQVAYDGFERYGNEYVATGITTRKSFRGNASYYPAEAANYEPDGVLTFRTLIPHRVDEPIPAGTYTISFWSKGEGGVNLKSGYSDTYTFTFSGSDQEWTYQEFDFDINYNPALHSNNFHRLLYQVGAITSTQDNNVIYIDELRVHPKSALMNNTFYRPLIGATQSVDANQRTMTTYYDPYRRVEEIRDHKNNIVTYQENGFLRDGQMHYTSSFAGLMRADKTVARRNETIIFSLLSLQGRCFSDGGSYNHRWSFGDGSVSPTRNGTITPVSHSYSQLGTYITTLHIEIVQGYWVELRTAVQVRGLVVDPTLNLRVSLTGVNNNNNCFTFTPTVTGGMPPYTYQWYSGDGTFDPSETSSTFTYCYTSIDNYTARVIVKDATNTTAEATYDILTGGELKASILGSNFHCIGTCNEYTPHLRGGVAPFTYEWTVEYEGRVIRQSTEENFSFSIPRELRRVGNIRGNYIVRLTVTDAQGTRVDADPRKIDVSQNCGTSTPYDPAYLFLLGSGAIGIPTQIHKHEILIDDQVMITFNNFVPLQPMGNGEKFVFTILLDGIEINEFSDNSQPTFTYTFSNAGRYTIVLQKQLPPEIGNPEPVILLLTTLEIDICPSIR
ncbi:hypothetical protein V9L05_17310 [Bernardetia sp. Wsw4-3y2]|uniref:PKD domain-containing protein n=1 Tax=Bernardetia sp. Wsw4-3y2 TaxID=3127471 RepID=UPI0030D5AADD